MIDLSKADRSRPNSVWVAGIEYLIHTEFNYWLGFEKLISRNHTYIACDYLYIWNPPDDRIAGYTELIKFWRNEQILPHDIGDKDKTLAFDWEQDSEYIWAGFLQQYGIDLITTDLHWHSFQSLFKSLVGTKLNEIMGNRFNKDKKGAGLKLRQMWEIRELPLQGGAKRTPMEWPKNK